MDHTRFVLCEDLATQISSASLFQAPKLPRPALLIENDEPTYLFGAADGYKKHGKISTNVQIPLIPSCQSFPSP